MQIENITIQLRHRTPWEALDLGRVMVRTWAGQTYRIWFATYWVIGVLLLLALWPWQEYAFLALWWIKPLFDRILLHTYSRSLFGVPTSVRDTWRALPGILRSPGVLSSLTLRRFSLARPFLLPVWQLEGQKGKAARARFKVLGNGSRGYALWLTFFCFFMSAILTYSTLLLLLIMMPQGTAERISDSLWYMDFSLPWLFFGMNLLIMAAETIIEPLYVASGFSLYLNRRSHLEGWDIELGFRRLNARKGSETIAHASVMVMVLLGILLTGIFPDTASASSRATEPEKTHVRKTVEEVLADPIFGHTVEELQWEKIKRPEKEKKNKNTKSPDWMERGLEAYAKLIKFLGEFGRTLVWIAIPLAAVGILYLLLRYRGGFLNTTTAPPPPDFLFGLDVRPASLPDDVVSAARSAADQGDMTQALSLLYRGALVALIHGYQVEFRAGDTETDCLQRTRQKLDTPPQTYFKRLLETWSATAYAHATPSREQVEILCQEWLQYFQPHQKESV